MPVLYAVEGAVSQGILWGLMTLGVYLTFRILNVADMTVDGSFAAGGALSAVLIVKGFDPLFSLFFVFILGTLCGLVTGFMNTKLKTFVNGFLRENPLLVLNIGLCSSLGVTTSIFNGLGMGIGYTIVLVAISLIRELLGGGTLFSGTALKVDVIPEAFRIGIFNSAPGGFLVFGILAACLQAYKQYQKNKADKPTESSTVQTSEGGNI